jgi:signal transduction histidine kinase
MENARERARLSLVLEMVSELASLTHEDDILRVVGDRLRWILDFDWCEFMLIRLEAMSFSLMGPGDEALKPSLAGCASSRHAEVIDAALASGVPASSGKPISQVAYPVGFSNRPVGVLCLSSDTGSFSHRDLRIVHHVCTSLSAVLARLHQERELEVRRDEALEREEQKIRERVARDEARAQSEAKDTFLAMLGHELRNPLAPIITATMLLRREVTGRALTRVEVIERQSRHLDRLVSDLLDVSRITNGKVNLQRAHVDLRSVASKSVEMALPAMDRKAQELILSSPPDAAMVDGDEARLAQVLTNLLNNASNYTCAGGRVELRIELQDGGVIASVSDNGIGMSAQTLETAFDMFVQGERSPESAPGGLGMGLAVSRALVEMHGGRIACYSAGEGLGTRVTVWLPRVDVDGIPALSPQNLLPRRTPTVGLRVLLVDDNQDAADSMAELVRALGHEVRVAYGPEQAIMDAPAFDPQVAILDIGLPMMDGHQLGMRLRTLLPVPLKLIALSGFGQESDRKKSFAHGFVAHLVKPADFTALCLALEQQVIT